VIDRFEISVNHEMNPAPGIIYGMNSDERKDGSSVLYCIEGRGKNVNGCYVDWDDNAVEIHRLASETGWTFETKRRFGNSQRLSYACETGTADSDGTCSG
jgi:hypothetical protein